MGGSLTNPTIKTDLKEVAGDAVADIKQQAVEFAQEKVETEKQKVKDSVNAVKNQVITDVKEDLKNKIFGNKDSVQTNNTDSTKKKAEQTIKNTINDLFKKKKKAAPDSTGN